MSVSVWMFVTTLEMWVRWGLVYCDISVLT
jgi:hypothetical protein